MSVWDNYECEGQIDIFDLIDKVPEERREEDGKEKASNAAGDYSRV